VPYPSSAKACAITMGSLTRVSTCARPHIHLIRPHAQAPAPRCASLDAGPGVCVGQGQDRDLACAFSIVYRDQRVRDSHVSHSARTAVVVVTGRWPETRSTGRRVRVVSDSLCVDSRGCGAGMEIPTAGTEIREYLFIPLPRHVGRAGCTERASITLTTRALQPLTLTLIGPRNGLAW
jgi:hypothetical protein